MGDESLGLFRKASEVLPKLPVSLQGILAYTKSAGKEHTTIRYMPLVQNTEDYLRRQ